MRLPPWVQALGATLLMQTSASFMGQAVPTVGPLLTRATGLAPERIGNLASLNYLGTVAFLACGGPILARLGPVRTLQAGAAIAAAALAVAAIGWWPALVVAGLALGVGYGPSPPAGSRILARSSPAEHRTLIFSVKQAGAPAGGALAGLIVAPVAGWLGWQTALLVAACIGLATAIVIESVRATLDVEREPRRSIHPRVLFHWRNLVSAASVLRSDRSLTSLTALAISFAMVQGCLFSFTVTYLVGQGFSLDRAGTAYAAMQAAGVFARIFLGWFADRTGRPAANLTAQAYVAALMVALFALLPSGAGLGLAALAAACCGFFAASWNGIFMAEVARLAPPERIADATSGSTMFIFMGYVVAPSVFSLLVSWTGDWRIPFLLVAAQLAFMALLQTALLLRAGSPGRRDAASSPRERSEAT